MPLRRPSPPPHHHGRAGTRHRPAEIGGDLGLLHLAAATFAIVVAVIPHAVSTDRAGIVGVVAELPDILDHHVDAMGVAFAEVAATGVVGALATEPDGAVADVVAAFALLAEAVILELPHRREAGGVIGAGNIDVLGADARIGPQDVARIAAGDGRDRPVLVVHVHARLVAAADPAADQHQGMAASAGALGTRHDERLCSAGLHRAV